METLFSMRKILFTIILFSVTLVSIGLYSCKHDPGPSIPDCEVTGVTYENYMKYLVEKKCISCHITNSIEPYLDTYADVMVIVNDGRLKNVLTGSNGYPLMPYQTEGLSDCTINNVNQWIDNGAPEQ